MCCAKDEDGDLFPDVIACQGTCNAGNEIALCEGVDDCPGKQCTTLISDYSGYNTCH
ncbi:MAG: hypothetical protein WKG00_40510 [Polyangiaceae bacterium]